MKFILNILLSTSILFALKSHPLSVDGVTRDYFVHVPKSYTKHTLMPLVIFLHGGGQNVKRMARKSLLNTLSDEKKFIVVYPVGLDKHWNDGRGVTYAGNNSVQGSSVDDVKFIQTLIATLMATYNIDKKKVYVTGVSNGGIMTLRLGCELSDKLSAIAPVIASMPVSYNCRPKASLSLLLMNGTADPIVPWEGGTMKLWKKTMGEVRSTQESITFWRKHNHCYKTPSVRYLSDSYPRDNSTVKLSRFKACKNNTSVQLYTIQGGGHTMPSKKGFNMPRLVGEKNRDIEGMRVIVDFLLEH